MKKLFCFSMLLALFATGCDNDDTIVDPAEVGYVQWVNASDHRITITLDGSWTEIPVLAPGESHMQIGVGVMCSFSIQAVIYWGCKIVFDDGPYGGYFPCNESGIKPLDPGVQRNYVKSRYDNKPLFTYTFTNADYDAAVARGPMEEGPEDVKE